MHATRQMSRQIDAEAGKVRRCLSEAREYLNQIGELDDPTLAEMASGALWDLVLEHRMSGGKLAPR